MGLINPRSGVGAVPPRNPRNRDPFIVCLGRHGDLINILPLAVRLTRDGKPIKWVVNREFAPTLEGCSYVEPIIVDAGYGKPSAAASIAQSMGLVGQAIIAQSYGAIMERQRKHKSYQIESWEVAHYAHEFGYWPTVFDKRDEGRENELLKKYFDGRPLVLVATSSVSSPIPHLTGVFDDIRAVLGGLTPDFNVIDCSTIKAERIYDMLALLDQAKLLVTVDSALLHLSRASKCPVIAITNDKWFGSVPPPSTIKEFKYSGAYPNVIIEAVKSFLCDSKPKPTIFHAVDGFKPTERHQSAFQANMRRSVQRIEIGSYLRTALSIGHDKPLPFLKDILKPAMDVAKDSDLVIWTNSDIELLDGIEYWAINHVGTYGASVMRRDRGHCGADALFFTGKWLRENWNEIPDYLIGAPLFDLGMRAMIRLKYGIKSTMENQGMNIFPADTDDLLTHHADHAGEWTNDSPAAKHNAAEFSRWISKYGNGMLWRQ